MFASLVMSLVKNALIAIKFRLFNSACAFETSMEKHLFFSFGKWKLLCRTRIFSKKASSLSYNFCEKGKLFAFCFNSLSFFTNSIQNLESLKAIRGDIVYSTDIKETFPFKRLFCLWKLILPFSFLEINVLCCFQCFVLLKLLHSFQSLRGRSEFIFHYNRLIFTSQRSGKR